MKKCLFLFVYLKNRVFLHMIIIPDMKRYLTLLLSYSFLFIYLFLFGCKSELWANSGYSFKQISLQDGLSQSMVKCVLTDKKGYIWIGTKSGLNRYDGDELKSYYFEKSNKNSLPDNQINFIAEDSLSNIWISTDRGLALYSRETDSFNRITYKGYVLNVGSFLHVPGGILFGGVGFIYEYSYTTKQIRTLPAFSKQPVNSMFNTLIRWNKNTLLMSNRWHGIWTYNLKTYEIKESSFFQEKEIGSMFLDSRKNLWISPYAKGVQCFSPSGKLIRQFTTANSGLKNNVVLDIKEKDGKLWFATDGGGINLMDMRTGQFSVIEHVPGDQSSIPVNSISCFYKDQDNNMYAGTIRGGLLFIRETFMKTYKDVPLNNTMGLSEKTVISLFEDTDGTLWIGTDGGGVNSFNPYTNQFRHYASTFGEKITSVIGFSDRELMITSYHKGIYMFNKQTYSIKPFTLINEEENRRTMVSGCAVIANRLSNDELLFLSDKVYLYNIPEKKFYLPSIKGQVKTQSSLQKVWSDTNITYLFGEQELLLLNNRNKSLRSVMSLSNNMLLYSVVYDGKNDFWLGTNRGLFNYSIKTRKLQPIDTPLFKEVNALVYDKRGRIWIGAQGMLFAYLFNEKQFLLYGESDGASPNEYIFQPFSLSRTGDLFIGGVMGLLRIDRNILFRDPSQLTIKLMDVLLDGASVAQAQDGNSPVITVPWNYTSLVIKITTKEKDFFRKKIFRYNVVGLNKNYLESYDHTLTLNSLPPGEYDIMVSCNTKDGRWTQPVKVLTVTVASPWWKTVWFTLCVITFLVGGAVLTSYLIIRKKENKLKWEMELHERKAYEEKVRFLINISHELRTPLTLIYAPLKRLLNGEIKVEELNEHLRGIFKQANRMKSIINMVLDLRKMEVGHDSVRLTHQPLNEWICSIAGNFDSEFRAKGITLAYEFDESVDGVSFDKEKCEIVLSNLLVNALKFSKEYTRVTLSTKVVGEMVRVSVKDEGIGLDGVDVNKLFTRYYQAKHNEKGYGIGLSYSKMLIEMHGGRIGAINNDGPGATFFYELSLMNIAEEVTCQVKPYINEISHSPEETGPDPGEFPTEIYSVLVVEDEPELRKFLKESLSSNFKNVYAAKDGQEALETIAQYHPDIVVSDVMMPRMDGFEMCRKVKENLEISHIPVILLTARGDSESTSLGYKLGADAYLAKPFDLDFLLTIIRNQLKNREYIKSRYKYYNMGITTPENSTFSNADEQFLLKLNALISENLANPELDVQFLTDNIGMSRASLYNKVKVLMDMSVNSYINKFRIEKAIALLTTTDLSMIEISEQTGFNNQRYFSTLFRQITGSTPTKYREEHQ